MTKQNPEVIILLSTYNGEKYLKEQLESIYNQTFWYRCALFVRDDGSKDSTLQILQKEEQKGNLTLICGENKGFVESFFYLIQNVKEFFPGAKYFSFADQDDFWQPQKIENAVKSLEKLDQNKPQLYFSDFDFCDSDLNLIQYRETSKKEPTFYESLTDCRAAGFTMLINREFLNILQKVNAKNVFYHDYFMYTLSFCFENPIYVRESFAKYRRHGNNESRSIHEKYRLFMWRLKNFLLKEDTKFVNMYKEILQLDLPLNEEYKKTLTLFCAKKNLKTQIQKMFFIKRFRQKLVDEILLRLLFLLGRM